FSQDDEWRRRSLDSIHKLSEWEAEKEENEAKNGRPDAASEKRSIEAAGDNPNDERTQPIEEESHEDDPCRREFFLFKGFGHPLFQLLDTIESAERSRGGLRFGGVLAGFTILVERPFIVVGMKRPPLCAAAR